MIWLGMSFFFLSFVGFFVSSKWFFGSFMLFWNIFSFKGLDFNFSFLLDYISMMFCSVLFVIVGSVFFFSIKYMSFDPIFIVNRFIFILLIFIFSMVFLIFVPSIFSLVLGWDGLGVSSVVLVLYYGASNSWSAGLKTYLTNRLGDIFLLCSIGLLLSQGHWENFFLETSKIFWFMFVTCLLTKSAQFPFSSWLPSAMAAPTPVSTLVHSSTLVTAGIYLIMRYFNFFPESFKFILGILGFFTLFLASFSACVDFDMKKMMAFSTLSQLGFMVISLAFCNIWVCFFHLMTHACFKALLFIGGGQLMMMSGHKQDMRKMLISEKELWIIVFSVFSLCGLPFFSGFFSKDLFFFFLLSGKMNLLILLICILSVFFTALYSFRLIYFLLNSQVICGVVAFWSYFPLFICSLLMGGLFMTGPFSGFFIPLGSFVSLFLMVSIMVGLVLSLISINFVFPFFFSKMFFLVSSSSSMFLGGTYSGKIISNIFDQGIFSLLENKILVILNLCFNFFLISSNLFFYFFSLGFIMLFFFI